MPICDAETIELPARLDQIAVALEWLEQLAQRHVWPARTSFGLILSADEALTNIVTYAFADADEGAHTFLLRCATQPDGVVLQIEDSGGAFDPTASAPEALAESVDEAAIGGHGVRLMRHYLRDLHYAREQDRNVLTLVAALA